MHISIDFFQRLANSAAEQTLPRFRVQTGIINKDSGGFDPVTEGDRAAERAIRAEINTEYPDHGIIGEEFGAENTDADCVWVIDPIDGTRAFISGLPLWGTLVGLTEKGHATAGMMAQPFTGELYCCDGEKSVLIRGDMLSTLSTSAISEPADAIMMTTSPFLFGESDIDCYGRLESSVKMARYGCDCYAYCMLASGHVDMVCESGLHSYDIVALIPIIEKAGGVVTTWDGGRPENGGNIIATANAKLHEKALSILNILNGS